MFKELEVLKLQLEILTEKYDDTETKWTTDRDEVIHYLDIAGHAITKAQQTLLNIHTKETQ